MSVDNIPFQLSTIVLLKTFTLPVLKEVKRFKFEEAENFSSRLISVFTGTSLMSITVFCFGFFALSIAMFNFTLEKRKEVFLPPT